MNREIYVFWFGPKMSKDRSQCFRSIVKNSGVKVNLVTEDNLYQYVVSPLFKGFDLLSSTHKSAYLRPYFMKYYGGCYMDIKYLDFNLNPYFEQLEKSNKDLLGYQEKAFGGYCDTWSAEDKSKLAGCGRYIFKPNTQIANQWYDKVMDYLDSVYDQLKDNPGTYHHRAAPGGIAGGDDIIDYEKYGRYPIPWGTVFGRILQETMYENLDLILLGLPYTFKTDPNFRKYR